MRHALFALTFIAVSVSAASAASIEAAKLQQRCPDLTYNQVGTELNKLVQEYRFSDNSDEALEQAGMLLCPTAEQRSMLQQHYATQPAPANYTPPPPRYGHPHGVRPQVAPPPHGVRPRVAHPPVRVQPIPVPVFAGAAPVYANAPSYGVGPQYSQPGIAVPPQGQRKIHRQTVKGDPYCGDPSTPEGMKIFERLNGPNPMSRQPGRYISCEAGEIPGKPCPGWRCLRAR